MQTEEDWKKFTKRATRIIKEDPDLLLTLWKNYSASKKKAEEDASLVEPLKRLAGVIKELIQRFKEWITQHGYSKDASLRVFFEICKELNIASDIDLSAAWSECLEDVEYWVENPDDPWEDTVIPQKVSKFLKIVTEFAPAFLQGTKIREELHKMLNAILERADEDDQVIFDSPKSDDDVHRRANGFDELHKSFEALAAVSFCTEEQKENLERYATHFWAEAGSLREQLPWEPDYDDDSRSHSSFDEVDPIELFRDL